MCVAIGGGVVVGEWEGARGGEVGLRAEQTLSVCQLSVSTELGGVKRPRGCAGRDGGSG